MGRLDSVAFVRIRIILSNALEPGTGLIHEFPVGSEKGRQFLRIVPDRAIPARIDVAPAKGYGKFPMRQGQGIYRLAQGIFFIPAGNS
jgi:hypothetical protein